MHFQIEQMDPFVPSCNSLKSKKPKIQTNERLFRPHSNQTFTDFAILFAFFLTKWNQLILIKLFFVFWLEFFTSILLGLLRLYHHLKSNFVCNVSYSLYSFQMFYVEVSLELRSVEWELIAIGIDAIWWWYTILVMEMY